MSKPHPPSVIPTPLWRRWIVRALYAAGLALLAWTSLGAVSRASLNSERYDRVGPESSPQEFAGRADIQPSATWTTEERTVSANGLRRRLAALQTLAVRSDGARVVRLGPEGFGGRTLYLPGNIIVLTHDELRTRSTQRRSHVTTGLRRRPSRGCTAEKGDEAILGVERVMGIETVKVASVRGTTWYALGFGCEALRHITVHPDGSVSRTELLEFRAGEPAASLFSVPVDYTEGPPSALTAAIRQATPCSQECRESQARYYAMHDADYWKNRVQ